MEGFRRMLFGAATLLVLALAPTAQGAQLTPIAESTAWNSKPIYAASPPGDARLFVAESGRGAGDPATASIRVVKNNVLLSTPYLSIPNVATSGERGFTSFAFDPNFASSGLLYVTYATGGQIKLVEYLIATSSLDVADVASTREVLSIADNDPNHNGGQIAFGPDGYLYMTTGDDSNGANAQTLSNLNGKVLRLSPYGATPGAYTAPIDNPFSSTPGADPLIWALGLRNPWRASFGPGGQLIVADVGQSSWEEIDLIDRGANYGWPSCEGASLGTCTGFASPFYAYPHDPTHGSIIGGYVARDKALTGIAGCYVYGDLKSKNLDMVDITTPGAQPMSTGLAVKNAFSLYSFGEDSAGRLYVIADGTVYRVDPGGSSPATCLPPAPGEKPAASRLRISTTGLNANRNHRVRIRVRCDGPSDCSGNVTVRSRSRIRVSGKRRSVVFLSTSIGQVRAGTARTKYFKLRRLGRKVLSERRSTPVKISVRSVLPGSTTTTSTRNVTLRR